MCTDRPFSINITRQSIVKTLVVFSLSLVVLSGCDRSSSLDVAPDKGSTTTIGEGEKPLFGSLVRPSTPTTTDSPEIDVQCLKIDDFATTCGLDFTYLTGAKGKSLMVETMGGGCGVLDFDNDGRWDLFLCQGGDPTIADQGQAPPPALYRNLGETGYVDLSAQAVGFSLGYSQGVVIGDYDGDGFDDVYVTNVGKNRLLRNQGDGTFVDMTEEAGVGDQRWSASAAFADLSGDGLLDLYVCNYLVYDPLDPLECRNREGEYRICHPREMPFYPNECFINQGDGTFSAEAAKRGLDGPGSKSLGVAVADFTGDDLPDVYIANDTTANFLFINQGDGTYREQALAFGCGVNQEGMYEAGMGIAVSDYDGDGFLDIYTTHFYDESNTLYRNQNGNGFRDVTALVGLHKPTLPRLGFGTVIQDLNADGAIDLFVTNGHIENYPGNPLHKMQPQVFTNLGRQWKECSSQAGDFFNQKLVGRGVAMVDTLGRGVPDVVVVHQDTPLALLRSGTIQGNWLNVQFQGNGGNRRGIGCKVTVTAGDKKWFHQLVGGGSYLSSHQPTLFFGLGETTGPCEVEVRWPSGKTQKKAGATINQLITFHESDAS
ncbi:MAG TPA: CRTAC1 family protein [Planctomycetaceae bacterium]|nr:CRTAC1 family protein [Planctomycetaceae bacterium]